MALFQKSKTKAEQEAEQATAGPPHPKHPKPKILLLDLQEAASEALLKKGFNVTVGTLGKPYKVQPGSGLEPLIGQGKAPNYTEQEIIIVDLAFGECDPGPTGEKHRPQGEKDLWGKCDRGFLDPRVRTACELRQAFDRAMENGGVLVLFADQKTGINLQWGSVRFDEFYGEPFRHDVWSLSSDLETLEVTNDHGQEMRATDTTSALGRLVAEFLPGGEFTCTLDTRFWQGGGQTLAKNKYGHDVAACRCRGRDGSLIILPQVADKVAFLSKLFVEVLPELAPHLFPDIEKARWIHRLEYELPQVISLQTKQEEIVAHARNEVTIIDGQIALERARGGWMLDLLTGTDAGLVSAVKIALEKFGFTKVADIDEERDQAGKSRREDLQIQDQSPLVVVDVKGIGGGPRDEDTLQAAKHASMRMREMDRTDIVGLAICNHQRHLPPLDRDGAPFRPELILAAEEQMVGLMTAWDLYRLVRNFNKLGWKPEHLRPLFYRKGRIEPIPAHYIYCGTIAKAWTDKFGVVTAQQLHVGDKIAVEFPIEFEEVPISSLRVNDRTVQVANPGDQTGILWPAGLPKLHEGMRVFRVTPTGASASVDVVA